jgi:carbonic anhydrase
LVRVLSKSQDQIQNLTQSVKDVTRERDEAKRNFESYKKQQEEENKKASVIAKQLTVAQQVANLKEDEKIKLYAGI